MNRLLVVRAGEFVENNVGNGDYDEFIAMIRQHFEHEQTRAEVETVASTEEAVQRVMQTAANDSVTVLYLTRGLLTEARAMKKRLVRMRHDVRVIVLTGLFPDDEVVVLAKQWLDGKVLTRALFH